MMKNTAALSIEKNILKAYEVLFAPGPDFSVEEINGLQLSSIKSAYRSMAFKFHPDRAKTLGVSEHILKDRFNELTHSYEKLYSFVQSKNSIFKPKKSFREHQNKQNRTNFRDQGKKPSSDVFSRQFGSRGKILIGQALFYSGMITLKALLEAITWQRDQRPKFGRIAVDMKILSSSEIISILKQIQFREKFGDCALRLGYINSFQHKAILSRQERMQRPICEYFIEKKILSSSELETMLSKQKIHNRPD